MNVDLLKTMNLKFHINCVCNILLTTLGSVRVLVLFGSIDVNFSLNNVTGCL